MRTGVFSSLANVLCAYPVLKPVRVWGCENRRPTREGQISTGSEVLRVINAEIGLAQGTARRREEQPRASQGQPSPPQSELSLSPPAVVQSAGCIMRPGSYLQICLRTARRLTLTNSHPLLSTHCTIQCRVRDHFGNSHCTLVLSFLLQLPERGAAWPRSPQRVLNHKGQIRGLLPLSSVFAPTPPLQCSSPVPPTHLIFYSQPRPRP